MRDYDPTLGRYIQGDPLGLVDGYALQNPGRYVDPRGENIGTLFKVGRALLKRSKKQKKDRPKHKDDRKIEKPKKIAGYWHCKCRADAQPGRLRDPCEGDDQKPYSFGSAYAKSKGAAQKAAEKLAKENLGGRLFHHVSCVCTGPKGSKRNRGG